MIGTIYGLYEETFYAYDSEDHFIYGVGESEEEAIEDLKDRQEKRTEVFTDFTKLEIFKTPEMRWKMACYIARHWEEVQKYLEKYDTIFVTGAKVTVTGGINV
jgi:hypothetical protein